eukprot:2963065-Rhodomonas_salina.4
MIIDSNSDSDRPASVASSEIASRSGLFSWCELMQCRYDLVPPNLLVSTGFDPTKPARQYWLPSHQTRSAVLVTVLPYTLISTDHGTAMPARNYRIRHRDIPRHRVD